MKKYNNNFLKQLKNFTNFVIDQNFFKIEDQILNKILDHFFTAHYLIIIFVKISFLIINIISLILYQTKLENLSFDKIEKITFFLKKLKFLQTEKLLELFHALSAIHINSEEKEEIIDIKNKKVKKDFFENIVIGSGPGGSITANELLKNNKDVLVIEKGSWVNHFKLKHPGSELFYKWRYGGLSGALGNIKIQYASGQCLGGGSEINSGLYHEPDEDFLKDWSEKFQTINLNSAELKQFIDESKEKTNVSLQNSSSFISKKIIGTANKNQWKIEEIPRWIIKKEKSFLKKSMTETYMKEYLNNNGEIILNTSADKIEKNENYWNIHTYSNNEKRIFKCKNLFLCCGSIDTVFLMKKSNLMRKKNKIYFHPMIKVIGKFSEKINKENMDIIPEQITEFYPKFILGNAASGKQFLKISSFSNKEFYDTIEKNWEFMSIFHATFSLGVGKIIKIPFIKDPIVKYDINNSELEKVKLGLSKLCKLLLDSGCEYVFPITKNSKKLNLQNYELYINSIKNINELNFSSVHILGGTPMGESENCVVNSFGQSKDFSNLYINDSSLVCNKLVKNPQGTIMAVALRNIRKFLKNEPQI